MQKYKLFTLVEEKVSTLRYCVYCKSLKLNHIIAETCLCELIGFNMTYRLLL